MAGARNELNKHGQFSVEFEPDEDTHILRIKTSKGAVCGSITVRLTDLSANDAELKSFAESQVKTTLSGIAKDPAFRDSQNPNLI